MPGVNRASRVIAESTRQYRKSLALKCIFLSHQKADREVCKEIANYIISADVDVYFDEYDNDLKDALQTNNPQGVTEAICKGINNSSHMLCIISPNTLASRWVPFEVGYGFDKTHLGVLTLKGIPDKDLPDYLKTAKILIRGTKSLNQYLATITNASVPILESRGAIKSHNAVGHQLDNYLDWNL
jgi:hypothetical protein